MADQKYGVQETKEAILALVILGKFVADRLKDGAQMEDAMALGSKLLDENFKSKVMAGVQGIEKVPEEIKDISFAEVFELSKVIPEILAEMQS